MSITASGAPPAFTVPATVTSRSVSALCSCSEGAGVRQRPVRQARSAVTAAGFRNTVAGASTASRSACGPGTGISAGAIEATTSASTPTTRSGTRLPAASSA